MEILYILLVLLIVTRIFGELAVRLGQPPLLGELISGILLGIVVHQYSGVFPILSDITEDEVFLAITDLGIFFLMLLGGMDLRPRDLTESSGKAVLVATGGMLLPLGFGLAAGWLLFPASDYKFAQSLFLGTALAITAVPVSIKVLMDLGQLESPLGKIIVSAAVIDDVISLILLAVLTAVIETGTLPDASGVLWLLAKITLFFIIVTVIGRYVFPRIGQWLKRSQAEEFEFSMLLIAAFAYALLAEALGMHFILGAFLAGLFFGRRTIDPETYGTIEQKVRGLTTGFLAPIFFASIGLHLDLTALGSAPLYVIGLIGIAALGKVVGAGLPARLVGFSSPHAIAIGVAMNARGAVELIIADIALRANLFTLPEPTPPVIKYLFSAIVIMAVVTTLFAPLMLRQLLRDKKSG